MAGPSPVIWGHQRPVGTAEKPADLVLAPGHGIALSNLPQHRIATNAELAALGLGPAPKLNFFPGMLLRSR
jgi:hypothetical protein